MTLEDKVHGLRLHALRRAEELGNVSAACRELDILPRCATGGRSASGGAGRTAFIPDERPPGPDVRPRSDPWRRGRSWRRGLAWPTWGPNRDRAMGVRNSIACQTATSSGTR